MDALSRDVLLWSAFPSSSAQKRPTKLGLLVSGRARTQGTLNPAPEALETF